MDEDGVKCCQWTVDFARRYEGLHPESWLNVNKIVQCAEWNEPDHRDRRGIAVSQTPTVVCHTHPPWYGRNQAQSCFHTPRSSRNQATHFPDRDTPRLVWQTQHSSNNFLSLSDTGTPARTQVEKWRRRCSENLIIFRGQVLSDWLI